MGDSWIVIPVIVGILILATLGLSQEASAQFYENQAYEQGLKVAVEGGACYFPPEKHVLSRLGPDPESAVKVELGKFQNPYYDIPGADRIYYQAWVRGFTNGCTELYLAHYTELLHTAGRGDSSDSDKECQSAGYDAGKAGNPREPSRFAIQMSHNQKFYHLLSDSYMKKQYEDGFVIACSFAYAEAYDKVESDIGLAREAGDLLDIKEEDVVEFFGGEEGVEQAYRENCVIATASYGSPMAKEVQMLREIRDNQLLKTESGSAFMSGFNTVYYSFAPTIAQWEQENPAFKEIVKTTITPLITSLSLLNHVSMDSEAEVLGYGISLILLNIGMYFVAPVAVVWQVKKRI